MKNIHFNIDSNIVNSNDVDFLEGTITITFSEVVENHVGMEKIGVDIDKGLSCNTLLSAKKNFESLGCKCELLDLIKLSDIEELPNRTQDAKLLIIRNGVEAFKADKDEMFRELVNQDWDKKAKMRGKVVTKHARWNLCISDKGQKPNYEEGKGTIIPFKELPETQKIRIGIGNFFKDNNLPDMSKLNAEGNYYYNSNDCYIGFHGDSERKIVIAIRLGVSIPLYYQWFLDGESKGKRIIIPQLNHGDVYAMSHKATGNDWKKRKMYTLRHAAGFNVPEPKVKNED